ncbi:hypothetical protein M758_6G060600 [Ceratodon purpureus]|nr:hypothetical protein M758_6G060600 [Ceratodon purpureus]
MSGLYWSLDMSEVENLSKTKDVLVCFESERAAVLDQVLDLAPIDLVLEQNRDGEPVESNEVMSVEDREESSKGPRSTNCSPVEGPTSEEASKEVHEQLKYLESNIVGEPAQSNEVTSMEDREKSSKRHRGKTWKPEETDALLTLMLEARKLKLKGKQYWNYISERLLDRHNFDRTSKNCHDRWGTVLKLFKAIRQQKSRRCGQSDGEMDKDESSDEKLPPTLPVGWFEIVERILAEKNLKRPHSDDHGANQTSDRKDYGTENLVTLDNPLIKREVDDLVDSKVEARVRASMTSYVMTSTAQEEILTSEIPNVKHDVKVKVNRVLKHLLLSGYVGGEKDLSSMLASDAKLWNIIDEALNSAFQPVDSALQKLALDEQEDQKRLQAIEVQKRALDREEKDILSKRRRRGRHDQKTSKRQVPRGKNYSATAGKIVPEFKGCYRFRCTFNLPIYYNNHLHCFCCTGIVACNLNLTE